METPGWTIKADRQLCDTRSMSVNLPARFTSLLTAKSDSPPWKRQPGKHTALALCQGCRAYRWLLTSLTKHGHTHTHTHTHTETCWSTLNSGGTTHILLRRSISPFRISQKHTLAKTDGRPHRCGMHMQKQMWVLGAATPFLTRVCEVNRGRRLLLSVFPLRAHTHTHTGSWWQHLPW